jgi:hypothetical protein
VRSWALARRLALRASPVVYQKTPIEIAFGEVNEIKRLWEFFDTGALRNEVLVQLALVGIGDL